MIINTDQIPAKMNGSMIKLLCTLREAEMAGESLNLTDLSKILQVETSSITQTQDRATAAGWVTSRHSAHDRRMKSLELTRAGLELVESMRAKLPASDLSDLSDGSETSEEKEAA
jgi:DNA-binding MarR family transcriptional regulator